MNIEQFIQWLILMIGEDNTYMDLSLLPKPIQAPYWEKVIEDMRPHYYGEMPPAIRKAFPNETPHQFEYRLAIHESTTEELLWQGISDVKRLIMSDKFAIQAGSGLLPFLNGQNFGMGQRMNFEKFLFDNVYPRRVLDPNALLAAIATPTANLSEPVDISLRIFPSGDILYFSKMLVIVFDRHMTSKMPAGVDIYRAFTLTDQIMIVKTTEDRETMWQVDMEASYPHNSGDLGVTPLGGREITVFDFELKIDITYFKSDFSFAVPQMNVLERIDGQLNAATLRTVFPHMVTQGIKCENEHCTNGYVEVRDANGEIVYKDADSPAPEPMLRECDYCHGKGTVALSVLDNITVTPPNNEVYDKDGNLRDVSGNIADKVIGFASPDIASVKELREQKAEAKINVEQALNLTKPSKFAESGVSKEKDREGKSTSLQDISDSMSMLAENTVNSIASLRFNNASEREDEIMAVRIVQPEDFQIKPVEELSMEFFNNLESKPQILRQLQFDQLLQKRFKNNPEAQLLNKLAFQYTKGLNLSTLKELRDKESGGFITRSEAIKAGKVNAVLQMMLSLGEIDPNNYDDSMMPRLFDRLDMLIQPFIDEVNNANSTQAVFPVPPPQDLGGTSTDE